MKKQNSAEALLAKQENDRNVKLALAIGWPPAQVRITDMGVAVGPKDSSQIFDYKDPALMWKLCVAYDAFPFESASPTSKEWISSSGKATRVNSARAPTPEGASYLAILEATKSYKPALIK